MRLEELNLDTGLSRQELRELFQEKIRKVTGTKINVPSYVLQQLENVIGSVEKVGGLLQKGVDYLKDHPQSRRTFLKAASVGSGLLVTGCAFAPIKEENVSFNLLKGHKIQPPENGCFFGFATNYVSSYDIDIYKENLDRKPSIFSLPYWARIYGSFPTKEAKEVADKSVIPWVFGSVGNELKKIVNGKNDHYINEYAEGARKFGEKYGGFFITTMHEMNVDRKYAPADWCDRPSEFKKGWRRIWNIFEETGANEYATWIMEYHVDFPLEGYYPGDKYVDWIGLSAYNRRVHQQYYGYRYLSYLITQPYNYFRRNHKDKPIILSEFGSTIGKDQPKWLEKAFKTIKSMHGLKGAIYWDNLNPNLNDDHKLSEKSLITLKEVLKDSYFITAK